MATSGQKKTSTKDDSYFWVKWSQASQDISNNKTKINWSCGVYCGHNYYLNSIKMSAVTINGTKVYSGGTYSNYSKGNHTIASGTLYIQHNSDGTKSFTISSFTGWLYENYNYSASSSSYTLNSIPRRAIVSAGENFTDSGNPKISFSNPAGFQLVPFIDFYDSDGNLVCGISRAKAKYSSPYTFIMTTDERQKVQRKLNTQKSYKVREGIITYNGTDRIGSSYVTKTFTIANASPTFSYIDAYDTNSATVAITGDKHSIVLGKSTLGITWNDATPKKGATISSYKVEWQGQTKTYGTSATKPVAFNITSAGTFKLKITVTDSRGYSTAVQESVTIIPYAKPNAVVKYGRVNNYEDEVHLTIDGSFSSVKVGTNEKNSMTIQWRWKKNVAGEGWSSWITVNDNQEYTYTFPKASEYLFNCKVTDAFGSTWNKQYKLSRGTFPLFIDTSMNAVGVNDFPAEGESFQVKGNMRIADGALVIRDNTMNSLGSAPATAVKPFISFRDKNGETVGYMQSSHLTDGKIRTSLSAKRLINGEGKYCGLWAEVDSDGNPSYGLTKASKFIEALGIADYVVEQGTNSNWRYRKWSSGKCEAWRRITYTNFPKNGTVNGWYYKVYDWNLPDGMFTAINDAHADVSWGTGVSFASARDVTTTTFNAVFLSNQDANSATVYLGVKGTWK